MEARVIALRERRRASDMLRVVCTGVTNGIATSLHTAFDPIMPVAVPDDHSDLLRRLRGIQ